MFFNMRGEMVIPHRTLEYVLIFVALIILLGVIFVSCPRGEKVLTDQLCKRSIQVADEIEATAVIGASLADNIDDLCTTQIAELKGSKEEVLKSIGDATSKCASFYHDLGEIDLKEYCHTCFILRAGDDIDPLIRGEILAFLQGGAEVSDEISKQKMNNWNFATIGGDAKMDFKVFPYVSSNENRVINPDEDYLVVFTSDASSWANLWKAFNLNCDLISTDPGCEDAGKPRLSLIDYDIEILESLCSLEEYKKGLKRRSS